MKIEDLSIGDIVLTKDGAVGKIDAISWDLRNCRYISVEGKGFRLHMLPDNIEPMPIYRNWLIRNGFEKKQGDEPSVYFYNEKNIIVHLKFLEHFDRHLTVAIKSDDSPKFISYIETNIYHVHELQHAMRLLGINKEMEII